jgi:hypothetical protein
MSIFFSWNAMVGLSFVFMNSTALLRNEPTVAAKILENISGLTAVAAELLKRLERLH